MVFLVVAGAFAFGADPDADPTTWPWVDFTADIRVADALGKTVGRGDESATADPSSCSFSLNNPVGDYTPRRAASQYYPHVKRGVPVWVLADVGDGYLDWYTGFVQTWAPRWDKSGKVPTILVTAKGMLHQLTQGAAGFKPPLYRAIAANLPVRWWPLEDGEKSFQGASGLSGGSPLESPGVVTPPYAAVNGPAGGGGKVVELVTGGAYTAPLVASGLNGSTTQWTVLIWYRLATLSTASLPTVRLATWWTSGDFESFFPGRFTVDVQGTDAGDVVYSDPAASFGSLTEFTPGQWHLVRVSARQVGTGCSASVWVDGVLQDSISESSVTLGRINDFRLGAETAAGGVTLPAVVDVQSCAVAHVEIHDVYDVEDRYPAGIAHVGETAVQRIQRLCNERGVRLTVEDGDSAILAEQGTKTLVELLRECEQADHGMLTDAGWFGLHYQPHSIRENAAVALSLLKSDLGEAPEPV